MANSGTIYIDLLVIINLYITFFLLRGTSTFLHRKISSGRILAGSLIGGLSSLIILLPPLNFFLGAIIKSTAGMLIVLVALGFGECRTYLKNAFVFIVINVVFAGLTLLLWFFIAPLGMQYNNGFVYFDISFPVLLITTALSYGIIRVLRYILDVKQVGERSYKITICNNGHSVTLDAIADSGNMLTDYFSGLSVIVCSVSQVVELGFAEYDGRTDLPTTIRLLPYNTIESSGLIPVYKAEEIIIKSDNMANKPVKALIGVSKANKVDTPAIFNPKLLI